MKTIIHTALFTILISMSSMSFAQYSYQNDDLDEGDVLVDFALARPLGLVGSVLGMAIHGVGLLASVPGGNFGEAGEVLVEKPLNYTFNRPLGRFEDTK